MFAPSDVPLPWREHALEAPVDRFAPWDAFERAHPVTFGGMYQFWCARR